MREEGYEEAAEADSSHQGPISSTSTRLDRVCTPSLPSPSSHVIYCHLSSFSTRSSSIDAFISCVMWGTSRIGNFSSFNVLVLGVTLDASPAHRYVEDDTQKCSTVASEDVVVKSH